MMLEPVLPQAPDSQVWWQALTQAGLAHAARGFGGLLGKTIVPSHPLVQRVPLHDLKDWGNTPEKAVVGIYLQAPQTLVGQMLLVLPYAQAVEVAAMLLDAPATHTLGPLEQSALAELGNLTLSYFLNAVAQQTRLRLQPTPPVVLVDMLGAILQVLVTAHPGPLRDLWLLHTTFAWEDRALGVDFWLLPAVESWAALKQP